VDGKSTSKRKKSPGALKHGIYSLLQSRSGMYCTLFNKILENIEVVEFGEAVGERLRAKVLAAKVELLEGEVVELFEAWKRQVVRLWRWR